MQKTFFSAKTVTYLAILAALAVVLQVFASQIQIVPGVTLNLALVPVVLGAMLLGPLHGAFLGFVSGAVVLIQVVTGAGGLFYIMFGTSPVMIALVCLVKTTAAGAAAGFIYKALSGRNGYLAAFSAAAAVPIVNTGVFLLGMLIMANVLKEAAAQVGLPFAEGQSAFNFVIAVLVTWNFFIELGINLVVAPGIAQVVRVVERKKF
ncbi:MAG: ECF transporter S component [Clostridia bacterium]|nr:ECF transporter S component [Clostridia bacterium]